MNADRLGVGVSNCRPASDVIASVQCAEELGAETAFIAEDVNCRDSFELCAVCAARTSRIRLSTGVVNPYTRNPTSLAMAAATLDEISEGRAALGLGTSSPSLINEQMGLVTGRSVRVMQEATEIIRALLSGETVDYAGERFVYKQATLEVRPVQQHIPIFFAAMGPSMLQLAGKIADGVLLNVGASTEYVRWAVNQIRSGSASVGRDRSELTVAAWLTSYVTDDIEAGLWRARSWLARVLSIPRQGELLLQNGGFDTSILPTIRAHVGGYPHLGNPEDAAPYVPAELADRLTLVGPPSRVRERLEQYRAAGVDLPVISITTLRALQK